MCQKRQRINNYFLTTKEFPCANFFTFSVVKRMNSVLSKKKARGRPGLKDSGSPLQGCLIHKPKGQGLLGFKPSILALHHQ